MDGREPFETWLESVCERHMPQNDLSRIRIFAKELAEGAGKEFWPVNILGATCLITDPSNNDRNNIGLAEIRRGISAQYVEKHLERKIVIEDLVYRSDGYPSGQYVNSFLLYAYKRWDFAWPNQGLLSANGFLSGYTLTQAAFALTGTTDSSTIFISYKRSESSAFAMFVLTRLKMEGLEPFLDLSLVPGEDWHAGLKQRIKEHNYDYLIAIIGKETLKSEVCLKEIGWAIEAGLEIIPVWHNEFEYQSAAWNLPKEIDEKINKTHAIRVLQESALGYNSAIIELLNRFGITP